MTTSTAARTVRAGFLGELALYRKLARQLRPYALFIAGVFLLSLTAVPLRLLTPLPLKIAVDHVIGTTPLPGVLQSWLPAFMTRSPMRLLIFAATLLIAVAALSQLQEMATAWLRTYVGEKLVVGFRAQLFRHAHRLSLTYHDQKGTADAIQRIQYDASSLQVIAIDGIIPLITSVFTLCGMIVVTARISLRLALISIVIAPILFLISQANRHRLRHEWREVKKLETGALAVVNEVLSSLRVVKAFGQEDREEQRFGRLATDGMRARLHVSLVERRFGLLMGLTTAVGTALVLFEGVSLVLSGTLTLGALLLVMSYLAQLYEPLKTMTRRTANLQSQLASAERAFALLDEEPDVVEAPHATPIQRARGAITFDDVSFSYEPARPILRQVAFSVAPGERVGIVGATGAGKTTIVSLLLRFYDPTHGRILLDGLDLRECRLADLRNQFSIVLQDPMLFATSIGENIAYARPGSSEREIAAAAEAANIHHFISNLPSGYNTVVGERGVRLSGGERQRVSLARAFLKNAPVLILDEPTSAVDVGTESSIMDALSRLIDGRTTVTITHRLSLLKDYDRILRVQDGAIVNAGSLSMLLSEPLVSASRPGAGD